MKSILFQLGFGEENYLSFLKPILGGKCKLYLRNTSVTAALEVAMAAKEKGCTAVATTNPKLLAYLLNSSGEESLDKYAGSIIEKYGLEWLILDPLEQLVTVPHMRFIYERYFKKLLHPEDWLQVPEFTWNLFNPKETDELLSLCSTATFIATDIETIRDDPDRAIDCIGFTIIHFNNNDRTFNTTTVVIPLTDSYNFTVAKAICRCSAAKVFQNGKYDNAYLQRFGIAVHNWPFDTINLFHSWYSELPKDLGVITAFMLRKWMYHKDEGKTGDILQRYEYNAKDAFVTAMDFLALILELPDWAIANYCNHEFPLIFPCVLSELTGLKVDIKQLEYLEARLQDAWQRELKKLQTLVANPLYNPGSWQQTERLLDILGCGDIKGTGKVALDKASARHPLNKRILKAVRRFREDRKLDSTYTDKDKVWLGRGYYALNPHGTDTQRLASKESQYWCGWQIHNIPRDGKGEKKDINIKSMFVADEGFYFGEADYKTAETYGTACLSGDLKLLEAIYDETKDFHGRNASMFFGVPYEKIIRSYQNDKGEWVHDKLDKELRDDIGKRINHGANYNMGPQVLLDTMGIENVVKAKIKLNLPAAMPLLKVCEYLLSLFDKTYPVVRGAYYDSIISKVAGDHFLVSPHGWSRYCFGNPNRSKRDLNRYAAHPAQNLNAGTLNKAYRKVFYNVWLPNQKNFKLGPQIHDSILFQYRIGMEKLAEQVAKEMLIPVVVKDTFGIERTLTVPVDLKGGADRWSEVKTLRH